MNNKLMIGRLFKYIGKRKFQLIFSLFCAVITSVFSLYIPVLAGKGIDCVAFSSVDWLTLKSILIKILIFTLLSVLSQLTMNCINNNLSYETVGEIRNSALSKSLRLPLFFIDRISGGDIVSRIINDGDILADGLILGLAQLFTGIVTIIGTLIYMLLINPKAAAVVIVLTPMSMVISGFISKKSFVLFKKRSEAEGKLTSLTDESVNGFDIIKSNSGEDSFNKKFSLLNSEYADNSLKALFVSSLTNPSTRFVNSMIYAVVGIIGAFSAISGQLSVGLLTVFLSYAGQYAKPFNEISGVIAELQSSFAGAERIFEIIDEKEEIYYGKEMNSSVSGNVQVNSVDFSYSKDKKILTDINLSAKAGENIAIVGSTGCGKTTLVNLLMRFYKPDTGEILIDGDNIQDFSLSSLRHSFGMVLQDTWVKTASVRENLCLYNNKISFEEMIEKAKTCHAHSFISKLPNGYDTVISDDYGLSQGQKQLINITRVMISDPKILILDEATSSVDTRTEAKIQDAFSSLMEGKTSFIVAHRLSTIVNCDKIVVMKNGQIIEQGKHNELYASGGEYTKMINYAMNKA
ncbi:MAG: ABC transporter ATP-binding protein/permease [Clostridiales bacterium]|nr:ABC transporter ATP-binding protein/permease [Clostridiales bacterium]